MYWWVEAEGRDGEQCVLLCCMEGGMEGGWQGEYKGLQACAARGGSCFSLHIFLCSFWRLHNSTWVLLTQGGLTWVLMVHPLSDWDSSRIMGVRQLCTRFKYRPLWLSMTSEYDSPAKLVANLGWTFTFWQVLHSASSGVLLWTFSFLLF